MTLDEELRLSYYKQISTLDPSHNVCLVQHIETNKIYVKKELTIFNASVYAYLKEKHIPNTPRIYEAVVEDERLIVIEEYINGSTLRDLVSRDGPMESLRAIEIMAQLCVIVDALHKAVPPIIHRDIKPSNVIISEDGVVKLLDMNAAKLFKKHAVEDTSFIGTVGYAAPEQYGFGQSSVQTDVFALGVVLNYMLTGNLPKERIAGGRLGDIVEKCTQIDPANRYSDADELCNVLIKEARRIKAKNRVSLGIMTEESRPMVKKPRSSRLLGILSERYQSKDRALQGQGTPAEGLISGQKGKTLSAL